jgi:hypothetical protein
MVAISIHQEVITMMGPAIHADKTLNRYSDHAHLA